jgi:hypothetical protein
MHFINPLIFLLYVLLFSFYRYGIQEFLYLMNLTYKCLSIIKDFIIFIIIQYILIYVDVQM